MSSRSYSGLGPISMIIAIGLLLTHSVTTKTSPARRPPPHRGAKARNEAGRSDCMTASPAQTAIAGKLLPCVALVISGHRLFAEIRPFQPLRQVGFAG